MNKENIFIGFFAFFAMVAMAQAAAETENDPAASVVTLSEATTRWIATDPGRARRNWLGLIDRLGSNGSVSVEALEAEAVRMRMRARVGYMSRLLVHDHDGDGELSRAEFLSNRQGSIDDHNKAFDRHLRQGDTNGDGILSMTEMSSLADGQTGRAYAGARSGIAPWDLRRLDMDGDGTISREDVIAAIDSVRGEPRAAMPEAPPEEPRTASCRAPQPGKDAKVVLLTGSTARALSTVAVGGMDTVTTVATITIEEGEGPLYIFAAAAKPIIWKIEGAVGRVSRFVVQPNRATAGPGAGVTGLPRRVVSFVPAADCLKYLGTLEGRRAQVAAKYLARQFDIEASDIRLVTQHHYLDRILVPSGKTTRKRGNSFLGMTFLPKPKPPEVRVGKPVPGGNRASTAPRVPTVRPGIVVHGASQTMRLSGKPTQQTENLYKELERSFPMGLIRLRDEDVVAPGRVRAYDVLPSVAGLIYLVERGIIRRTSKRKYVILKPIPRIPSGLPHLNGIKLLLAKGVPLPPGASMASVYRLDDRKCMAGPVCDVAPLLK